MRTRHRIVAALAGGVALCVSLNAGATTLPTTYEWKTTTGQGAVVSGSGDGNMITFTSGSQTLKARAFYTSDPASNKGVIGDGVMNKGTMTLWSGGLGASNPSSTTEDGSPNHAVDNDGLDDALLFEFNRDDYIATGLQIGWNNNAGGGDSDIQVWVGGAESLPVNLDLTNKCLFGCVNTLDNIAALGFKPLSLIRDAQTGTTNAINPDNIQGRYMIVTGGRKTISGSGDLTRVADSNLDYFKISKITARVPEPTTVALLGIALLGIAATRRRD